MALISACAASDWNSDQPSSSRSPPTRNRSTSPVSSAPSAGRPATVTPDGMWWGVDSAAPLNAATLGKVRGWYQGATPQMWGRYLLGHRPVDTAELAFARQQGIYVYLLVPDGNCSRCGDGEDRCGNDVSPAQAILDARDAVRAAVTVRIRTGAVLFKDIEQVSSCRGEPTAAYLLSWYRALQGSGYRAGFYGNTYRQSNDFPRAYCASVAVDPDFAAHVIMDANEPEPAIGAPRNAVGPHDAPTFAPFIPSCSRRTSTDIWQYGESTSIDDPADVDQARPDTPGMLAPDGTVTGA
jgi:Domain of unknown function (DUF1906)